MAIYCVDSRPIDDTPYVFDDPYRVFILRCFLFFRTVPPLFLLLVFWVAFWFLGLGQSPETAKIVLERFVLGFFVFFRVSEGLILSVGGLVVVPEASG